MSPYSALLGKQPSMPLEVAMQLPDASSLNSYQDTVDMFTKIVKTIFLNKNKNIQLTLPLEKNKTWYESLVLFPTESIVWK